MSERMRRIRKRERELLGRPPKFGSQKRISYEMKDKFTQKFITKKETLIDFKIDERLNNWERIKEQLELGHLEIMDEKLKQTIISERDKADFIRPMIIIEVDCYDDKGKFIETREILAYDKQKEGNWLDLESKEVDDSIYDQIIELDDRINDLDALYDYDHIITGASIYYGVYYGA